MVLTTIYSRVSYLFIFLRYLNTFYYVYLRIQISECDLYYLLESFIGPQLAKLLETSENNQVEIEGKLKISEQYRFANIFAPFCICYPENLYAFSGYQTHKILLSVVTAQAYLCLVKFVIN